MYQSRSLNWREHRIHLKKPKTIATSGQMWVANKRQLGCSEKEMKHKLVLFHLFFLLSPPQERQFIPLLCLFLRLHLPVRRSRPADHRHHWLGNMVTLYFFFPLNLHIFNHASKLTHTNCSLFCLHQRLDLGSHRSQHQRPSRHHHAADCSPVHCAVRGLPYYVQKGKSA